MIVPVLLLKCIRGSLSKTVETLCKENAGMLNKVLFIRVPLRRERLPNKRSDAWFESLSTKNDEEQYSYCFNQFYYPF